jgi:import receptor subunit TOM70
MKNYAEVFGSGQFSSQNVTADNDPIGPTKVMAPLSQKVASTASNKSSALSRWIEENRTLAVTLGVGTVIAGGAGVYYYLNASSSDPKARGLKKSQSSDGNEKGASSSSKKKKSKKKKATNGAEKLNEANGPLLEEVPEDDLLQLSAEEIQRLPEDKRQSLAQTLKTTGNKAYQKTNFEQAIEYYTKAIAASPAAAYFSNRAACYHNLGQPQKVIDDCNEALKLEKTYVKALNRRAIAGEQIAGDGEQEGEEGEKSRELLFNSLCDFTAVAILGQFKDPGATTSVERILKKIAYSKAKNILQTRELRLPSPTFVTAYLEAFRPQPIPSLPDSPSQGDKTLILAYQAVEARNYPHAFSLFTEALEQGISQPELEAAAYNMSGTFKFVIGNARSALDDLVESTSIKPDYVQSWVKKASVHMELADKEEAMRDFETAIKANPNDPDIYYHRGQVHFILNEYDEAIKDYKKSTELDDSFIFSQVQLAVAQYKLGKVPLSTRAFENILKKFSTASEAYNYYGELLLDQQEYERALAKFDKAIEIEEKKERSTNVLPMINKALALFQWKQEMAEAETLCRKALDKDPDCDVAVATLAQLSLQQGKIKEAITYFERSAQIARTEPELINAITYENAARAQRKFIEEFPQESQKLQSLATSLGAGA